MEQKRLFSVGLAIAMVAMVVYAVPIGPQAKNISEAASEVIPLADTIYINGYEFDINAGEPTLAPELTGRMPADGENGLFLVHCTGPIMQDWVDSIGNSGGEIITYVHNFAYEVKMTPETAAEIGTFDFVNWVGIFHPAYKVQRDIAGLEVILSLNSEAPSLSTASTMNKYMTSWQGSADAGAYSVKGTLASASFLDELAADPDVQYIAQYYPEELHDEVGMQICGGFCYYNDPDSNPATPYRTTGTNGAYINHLGWDGTGVCIAVADTGLGNGATGNAGHNDFTGRVTGGYSYDGSDWADGHAHGTHCAGLAAADGAEGNAVTYGGFGPYYVGNGIAPEASLYSVKIFSDAGAFLAGTNYGDIVERGYIGGAEVHSNSWGSASGGAYGASDVAYDQRVRDAHDTTAGNQPIVVLVSAGNSGSATNTIGSPGNAKNVITVGGVQNYMPDGTSYGNTYGNSNNPDAMYASSSRGWTDDGRIKPDILTPGQNTLSTHSPSAPANNLFGLYSLDNRYEWCTGTSQSCPTASGAAAALYQWYQSTYSEVPAAATIKALLINSAADINTADIPNQNEGWGRMYLPPIVDPASDWMIYNQEEELTTGAYTEFDIKYVDVTKPLKITLVWTDDDAASGANPTLRNDLRLQVTNPSAVTYNGNRFTGGYSTTGNPSTTFDVNQDGNDDRNNVECVYFAPGSLLAGTYTVRVTGFNVPADCDNDGANDQDYSLVMYNAEPAATTPTATATGPLGGPTTVTAVTLTYTYANSPTSVNLYYTKSTSSPYTWVLAGNDASVNGNYAYTITAGTGTYGWLASAVGGGSTEPSPPGNTVPPEATSYILDITAPAAPTGLTVEHYGLRLGTVAVEGFQGTNGGITTSANLALTVPAGITAGELLLLIVGNSDNTNTAQFSNNLAGWNFIGTSGSATPDAHIGAFWRTATGTEGAVTVVAQSADYWWGWYIRISGAATTTPINVQNFAISTATGVNPHVIPEVTTTVDNCLAIYALSFDGGDGPAYSVAGAGWTESAEQTCTNGATYASGCWGTKTQATAGATGTASVTCAVIDGAAYFQLAIRPSSSGTLADNTLNWTHSGTDVDHYNIYRSDVQAGTYTLIGSSPVGTNTYCDVDRGQADSTRWWYRVRAVDAAGNEETNTNSVQEPGVTLPYSINLSGKSANSWVYVSFPSATSGNIQTILNDATAGDSGTTWTVAKWYNIQTPADPWKTYRVGGTANDMPTLTNTMGVWLWITANSGDQALTLNAYIAPSPSAVNINLYTGWNMVGYPTMTSRAESATLPAQADLVASWQAASPYITQHAKGATLMSHGNAYWVHVTADCTWAVQP